MDLRMAVSGMNCAHCAGSVKRELERLQEGLVVEVLLEKGEVVLIAEHLPDEERLQDAVERAGFQFGGFLHG
jgi:copper chaperone CopZ